MRTLGKLDPNSLFDVIDMEYMVNGFKPRITAESSSDETVTLTSLVIFATDASSNECNTVQLIEYDLTRFAKRCGGDQLTCNEFSSNGSTITFSGGLGIFCTPSKIHFNAGNVYATHDTRERT